MEITFRVHALKRMFERGITRDEVVFIIEQGQIIRSYDDDKPYPSKLLLAWVDKRPLHVVVAETDTEQGIIVITVYEPDPQQWDSEFKKKKPEG